MNGLDLSISSTIIFIVFILIVVGFSVDNNMALLSGCVMMFMFIMGYFSIYINGLINRPRNNIEIQKFPIEIPNQGIPNQIIPNQENKHLKPTQVIFKLYSFHHHHHRHRRHRRRRRRQPQSNRLVSAR
jgi:hypothetical protein